jgi:hypothetical protein
MSSIDENYLFEHLKVTIPDLSKPAINNRCYDAISEEDRLLIEFKCRRKHYNSMLIEKKKYFCLLEKSLEFGMRCLYINSTPEGVFSFDLGRLPEPRWDMYSGPSKTHWQTGRKFVNKEVGYLPLKSAEDITHLFS